MKQLMLAAAIAAGVTGTAAAATLEMQFDLSTLTDFSGDYEQLVMPDADTSPEPRYVIEVDSGVTTNLATWLDAEGLTLGAEGTIVKKGPGNLKVDYDISVFTGAIHVVAGRYVCAHSKGAGNVASTTSSQPIYVHEGAAFELSSTTAGGTKIPNKTAWIEGHGTSSENDGALWSSEPAGSGGIWPKKIFLTGDASVGMVNSRNSWQNHERFDCRGHNLTMYNVYNSYTYFSNVYITNAGNLIVKGGTLFENYQQYCFIPNTPEHKLVFTGKNASNIGSHYRTNGGTGYDPARYPTAWTMVMDAYSAFHCGMGRNGYHGPVQLLTDICIYRQNNYSSQTHFGKISGNGCIGAAGCNDGVWLRLANPENDFTGGVKLSGQDCWFTFVSNGVMPVAGGPLIMGKGGYVRFGHDQERFDLPDLRLENSRRIVVTDAQGAFRDVTKKDTGLTLWNSRLGGRTLDLQKGTFRFPAPNAGLWEGWTNTDIVASSANRTLISNAVDFAIWKPNVNQNAAYSDLDGRTGPSATYSGWLCNRTAADKTWTFAGSVSGRLYFYLDGSLVFSQTATRGNKNTAAVAMGTVTLPAGCRKRFELRVTGNGIQCAYDSSTDKYGWNSDAKGFVFDQNGGTSTGPGTYTQLTDDGTGALFVRSETAAEGSALETAGRGEWGTLVYTNYTANAVTFDLCGNSLAVTNVVGYPVAQNLSADALPGGTLTVRGNWTLPGKTANGKLVPASAASVAGTLAFGPEATVTVPEDDFAIPENATGYVIATATAITGRPRVANSRKWQVLATATTLTLAPAPGLTVSIR